MEFDHILIGSGLSALAVATGLPNDSRILVLTGGEPAQISHYDKSPAIPCDAVGLGGLGEYWHGVIPTGWNTNFSGATDREFVDFFSLYYPGTRIADTIGKPRLFVPREPIRPQRHWAKLAEQRQTKLMMRVAKATHLTHETDRGTVTADGTTYSANRVWLAAGPLRTPALLEASFGPGLSRDTVDDHAIIYLGLVDRKITPSAIVPRADYDVGGMWIPCRYQEKHEALLTSRPARFDFATIDRGIARRAAFGLPTGNAIARILRQPSPGLVSEALFNKLGLFPGARVQSIFGQIVVRDAHGFDPSTGQISMRIPTIVDAADAIRAGLAIDGLMRSQRTDLFIPGIHLHHTLDRSALTAANIDDDNSPVLIADASGLDGIGPDHHSFKMMLAAFLRARNIAKFG